jgi:hypothetical protein
MRLRWSVTELLMVRWKLQLPVQMQMQILLRV